MANRSQVGGAKVVKEKRMALGIIGRMKGKEGRRGELYYPEDRLESVVDDILPAGQATLVTMRK